MDSVPLSIYAAQAIATASLDVVLGDAIRAGGDTDTIGSMAGQIAGAHVGKSGLPRALLDLLRESSWIAEVAERFVDRVERST